MGLQVYADAWYAGASLSVINSVPDLRAAGYAFNDRASSLTPSKNTVWAVYADINYSGACETVTEDIPWLGATNVGNDNISSILANATCAGPVATSYVTDLTVVNGGSADITCPSGYTKKWQDLNQGAGGDFVFACVQYGTNAGQALQEIYVMHGGCNGDDVKVGTDLNSGATQFGFVHYDIYFCKHRPGTTGGSGYVLHSGVGPTTYFPPAVSFVRDLNFWRSENLPPCAVHCDGADWMEWAQNAVQLCQSDFSVSWNPTFAVYQGSDGDSSARVPANAGVKDLNVASHFGVGGMFIYGCVRDDNNNLALAP